VAPLRWGFHNETWRVDLVDGRRVAVTRLADGASASAARRTTAVAARLRDTGLPVPAVVDPGWRASTADLLATSYVNGEPGAELLDREGGAATVGAALGEAWHAMQAIDSEELDLPWGWSSAHGLAAAADRVTRGLAAVGPAARPRLLREVAIARETLAARATGFVHGDYVPVNAVLRDGRLAGIIDLERAARADPLTDPAWFLWIVGYHHPVAARAAWLAFVEAARIDIGDRATRTLIRTLPVVLMLERLDAAGDGRERGQWIAMLRRSAGNDDPGGA
jgi:aminoglycoside phosphotransferase (APT) family kinase protein